MKELNEERIREIIAEEIQKALKDKTIIQTVVSYQPVVQLANFRPGCSGFCNCFHYCSGCGYYHY